MDGGVTKLWKAGQMCPRSVWWLMLLSLSFNFQTDIMTCSQTVSSNTSHKSVFHFSETRRWGWIKGATCPRHCGTTAPSRNTPTWPSFARMDPCRRTPPSSRPSSPASEWSLHPTMSCQSTAWCCQTSIPMKWRESWKRFTEVIKQPFSSSCSEVQKVQSRWR